MVPIMATDMVLTKAEAIEKADSRARALSNLKHKVKASANRMAGAGVTIAGGFVGGVVRAKMPNTQFGGYHVNQIGGALAVGVGLAGVLDDDASDLLCDAGAGVLGFELGRAAEQKILADAHK